jgi:putative endonuclease
VVVESALMKTRQIIGKLGEDLACAALARRGYEVVARNWRCPAGEIDIVARDGDCWAFVEVKTRRGRSAGLPEDAFTPRKSAHLTAAAEAYLAAHELVDVSWRLDLVAVDLDGRGGVPPPDGWAAGGAPRPGGAP